MRSPSGPLPGCAVVAVVVLSLACNSPLETGLGEDNPGGPGTGCDACMAPQTCSKAAPVCIEPGTCAGDADCEPGTICGMAQDGRRICVVGGRCGGQEAMAEAVPPNLLVVLDRSCSMRDRVGNRSKWEIAVAAIQTLTTQFRNRIRFGLTLFPDRMGNSCTQESFPVPVGPGKEMQIQSLLAAALNTNDPNYPNGPCVTNIDTAMDQASREPAFMDASRQSFTLLVTDGMQAGCNAAGGDAGTTSIINNLRNRRVRTFVVGFGGGVDAAQLNAFAMAGGTNMFYRAEDQMTLERALSSIASQTLGCDYQLMQSPPNPQQIYVFFDNTVRVPRDPARRNGWDYDEGRNRVIFYGAACDELTSGRVKDLDIVFGCDAPTPG
ncbi:MAG: vWA domain-containing protein [Myxococcales bacterium]|nr:VWA domain-containing protein [Myxococcota bacterium]MDW8281927.1 vWA domain-containing protein [Myxococcales bacterium]